MRKKMFLAIAMLMVLGCGAGTNSAQTNKSEGASTPVSPEPTEPSDPGAGPPNDPSPHPPVDEKDPAQSQVCYLQTGSGRTCFAIHPKNQAHAAEPLYNYIDTFRDPNFPSSMDQWQYRSPVNLLFSSQHLASAPLAENFIREEVLNSNDTRGHYGFFSPDLISKMQQMRNSLGRSMIINSGYRSPGYNSTLPGAARFSRHTYGDAIDFKVPGVSLQSLAQRCLEMGASFYQLYATHVHCDWRNSPLNEAIYGPDLRPTVHSQSFVDLQKALSVDIGIDVVELTDAKKTKNIDTTLRLAAITDLQEDPGDVLHDWQIVNRNGEFVKSSNQQKPVIHLKPGVYTILLNWGGSLETSTTVSVD